MKNLFITFRSPAIISLVLVLPFLILEFVNRRAFHESFPMVLFGSLWLLPVIFMITLQPLLRKTQTATRFPANPAGVLIRAILLIFIARVWTEILLDQMPCFLGFQNCD